MVASLVETFGFKPGLAIAVIVMLGLALVGALVWVFLSAPPRTITVSSGPKGSTFERYAESYVKPLAAHGVKLQILPSEGSLENLHRLTATNSRVDIAFVQGGLADGIDLSNVVSLGSIAYEPLWIFYRGTHVNRISELAGHKIAIGAAGSGTHALAVTLLQLNGLANDPSTTLLNSDAEAGANELLAGKIDALFLMGDSAPVQTLRTLMRSPDVQLYAFTQADAYSRRLPYLSRMTLPEGSIDFGKDLPAHDAVLVGPTVELVARKGLHPALTDILIEAAQGAHSRASLMQKAGEFPAPLAHEFALSDEAVRYYKSGKGFMYDAVRNFWLASLLNRVLVVFVPALLVLVPAIRVLPVLYKWRISLRLYRCYRPLLALEREIAGGELTVEQLQEVQHRLGQIEAAAYRISVPASFANQLYNLRSDIIFVRKRLENAAQRH